MLLPLTLCISGVGRADLCLHIYSNADGRVIVCILGTRPERIFLVVSILNIYIVKNSNLHIQLKIVIVAKAMHTIKGDYVRHNTLALPIGK